ncbi:hypothetical protein ABXJ76_01360 [Methylobacter sp. G7]|uniref:hypothetical protein n=1 Tax=Methylobacter sp. G7 TaxID=3230117 RepID=UPI003D8046E6
MELSIEQNEVVDLSAQGECIRPYRCLDAQVVPMAGTMERAMYYELTEIAC